MKSLTNLTVGEYQELYTIHKSKDDELDKAVQSVALITGKPRWDVEDMDMDKFSEIARAISILFSGHLEVKPKAQVKINGKSYHVCLNPRKLSAGQYIDLQHFLKGDMIENLHKIMACIVIPHKKKWGRKVLGKYDGENHESISEGIKELRFTDIHSTCVFFSLLWRDSIKAIIPYLSKHPKMMSLNIDETNLRSIMDGYSTLHPLLSMRDLS